ncbi:helix-turn-helix domain-containing protein [Spirilliplanes yamanashiensis]|uniref:AraC family transcriptional regulator n=1 Tax=Spirilliplanes yamanashiensis TaxID=42233 RepID=A0A8J4DFS3_9ACTN|nr:helix-turn-helix domain-containing protein [Spirilliplanes yamanashiensis]MDP9814332.1 transcriptional regulator GlxA family with amidase domain [Spirilliplanes yamanashiensis]GIJ00686.1 AraC family transcriptional regulator [Spirilliplanes yamanashiensis]
MSAHPFRSVAAYVSDGFGAFGLGIVSEIFGYDRSGRGLPRFDFAVCADVPGPLRSDTGLTVLVEHGLDRLAAADLVIVTGWEDLAANPSPEALAALRAAYDRGATIASHCTGAYVLAAAGLLDGRRATTHWRYAEAIAARYPAVRLEPEVLYIDEGRIVTGAGSAAGLDLSLHLLRREYGSGVATALARDLVVPPHRDGGQAQYVAAPVPDLCEDNRLQEVIGWARENLHLPLSVEQLAARALMSPRSFARHFKAATGATPHAWLLGQRVHRAEELLETHDLSVEEVARMAGFGTSAALREQFVRRRGVPPRDYRRAFATR